MRFIFRSLWSGGAVVGGIISAIGLAQWVYEVVRQKPFEIHIQWYVLVIIGLVIVLVSSLNKAYSLHKAILQKAKVDAEQERYKLVDKMRQLARLPVGGSTEPLSLDVKVNTVNRSMSDIYPEIPSDKKGVFFKVGSISAGIIYIQNNSVEPVEIEIEYEILGGNIPILLQNRVDTTPVFTNKHVYRSMTINPKGKINAGFIGYGVVDRFHKGFKFPSYLSSSQNKLNYRIEGRISVYKIGIGKIGELPHLDIQLRVIGTSAVNISKVIEYNLAYRIKANPITSELTLDTLDMARGK